MVGAPALAPWGWLEAVAPPEWEAVMVRPPVALPPATAYAAAPPELAQPALVTREPSKFQALFIMTEKYWSLSTEQEMLL